MAVLQLYFLGPMDICSGGRRLPRPPTLKSQSLLAYLVYHRGLPQPRDYLAGLFFGERAERKARRSLSTALWHIHRCLPKETFLINNSQTVQFDPQNDLWLDTEEFEAKASLPDSASLHSAVSLYRGDFLEGFYDDWIINERYRLESIYLDALARLMNLFESGKDYPSALATALRLLGRDALREDAYQTAMRAYCHLGQRKLALEQYERCQETALKELGAQPMIETRELYQSILEGRFEGSPLPDTRPIEILSEGPAGHNPFDVTATTRMVGREQESLFLENCWHAAQAGNGRLTLIGGEVGVGKTRLVEEFANRLRWQGIRVLWGRCYEFERTLPYQPVTDALRTLLLTLPNDALAGFPAWALREVARLVPELVERSNLEETYAEVHRKAADFGPALLTEPGVNAEQARLFEGVTRVLAELASQGGLLVVLEDLHWTSESTLQLLHYLVRQLSNHLVLIVGTFRPEAVGPMHPLRILQGQLIRMGLAQQIELSRLSPPAVESILIEMSGVGEAVAPLAERLYRETEGNAFFLMEIIKALFETKRIKLKDGAWQGDLDRISESELPMSVSLNEAVLARVERLRQNAQETLRLAAVLGREFNFEPLNAVLGKGEEATLEALDDLLRHRLVEEKVGPDDSDFAFTHHKIQEVVYQTLSRHRCLRLHAQVGTAMESIYSAELETRAGELAYHFEQACRIDPSYSDKAIAYLLKAGQQAVRQFANQEGVAFHQRGLDILRRQPETSQRMRQEVELLLALAVPTTAIKGYASAETKRMFDQARDLCMVLGETPELFTSLVGLARYYGVTGDLKTQNELGEQLLTIARKANDADLLIEAYRERGNYLFQVERLKEACEAWESSLALYDLARHEENAYRFGHDPAITCLGYLSMALWLFGLPEQSLARSQKLCSLIPSFTQPSSQAYGYCHLALNECYHGNAQACGDYAETAIHLGQLHGLSSWTILATALKGWALFERGDIVEGEALLNEGTKAWQARGFVHFSPFLLSLQAEAFLKLRKWNEGMDAVTAALAKMEAGSDRCWKAKLEWLQGELLWAQCAHDSSVETYFRQSINTARQQGVRILELRAAVSLARLWQSQGKPQPAQQALAGVYNQFTEGFNTRDLLAAQALLEELNVAATED